MYALSTVSCFTKKLLTKSTIISRLENLWLEGFCIEEWSKIPPNVFLNSSCFVVEKALVPFIQARLGIKGD